jgi:hypothetical protein
MIRHLYASRMAACAFRPSRARPKAVADCSIAFVTQNNTNSAIKYRCYHIHCDHGIITPLFRSLHVERCFQMYGPFLFPCKYDAKTATKLSNVHYHQRETDYRGSNALSSDIPPVHEVWHKPTPGIHKLNVDRAFVAQISSWGADMILPS